MKSFPKHLYVAFLLSGLMILSCSAWAQQAKQPGVAPAPRTEEIREAVQPAFDQPQQETPQEVAIRQQKEAEEARLAKEQEAAALRERELESKKVVNPNWRNKKSPEEIILETQRAEVEALNQYEKELRLKQIQQLEQQLMQTTDEGLKVKLANKIDNLKNHPSETGFAE